MKKIILLTGALFSLGMFACKQHTFVSGESEYVVYKPNGVDLLSSGIFKKITAIPLETNKISLIGASHQLHIADNGDYYITMNESSRSVLRFDSQGNFLNTVGRGGRGPQEYIRLYDFAFDSEGNPIIYSSQNGAAYYFAPDGEFLKTVNLGSLFLKAVPYKSDHHFLYLGFNNSMGPWRLIKVDNERGVTQRYLENDHKVHLVMETFPVFSHYNGAVYMRESLNNIIYRLTDDRIEPVFRFDFGRYNIPKEFFNKRDVGSSFELLMSSDFVVTRRFMQNDDYVLFEAQIQKDTKTDNTVIVMVYGLKDKRSGNWSWFDSVLNPDLDFMPDDLITGSVQSLSVRNEIVCLVDPGKLLEHRDHPLLANPEVLVDLTYDSNHVILLCELE